MSTNPNIPGINYPPPTGNQQIDQAVRNIYDNLFYLKGLAETIPVTIPDGGTGATSADSARSNLGAAKAGGTQGHTITLVKLTGGGNNGSITWNSDGCITSFKDPT